MNRVKQLVHAENVYRMGYTGKNIRVVTLDTGVYLHPDLRQARAYHRTYRTAQGRNGASWDS